MNREQHDEGHDASSGQCGRTVANEPHEAAGEREQREGPQARRHGLSPFTAHRLLALEADE